MKEKNPYFKRLIDDTLDRKTKAFNAINIVGPKGCGKTRSAKERSKTIIEFQDEEKKEAYISVAETKPSLLLNNEKPILFDEWQDVPQIWGAIRKNCDDNPEDIGSYYLTGSSSKHINTSHTGTGRISELQMYPMTLFETEESNGKISLTELIESPNINIDGIKTDTSLEQLIFAICRGGWPRTLLIKNKNAKLDVAYDYHNQIIKKDISSIDNVKRNEELAKTIIWSYARNIATITKQKTLYEDVKVNFDISLPTFNSYVEALKKLYVIKDIDAWCPQIRSKTAIRSAKKHIFIDPSIAIASLGIGPDYFNNDFDLFGHVFENEILRDLCAFASLHDASVLHYHDDFGIEIDAIYQLRNGKYALIEIKRGVYAVKDAEETLISFVGMIKKHNINIKKDTKHPGVEYRLPEQLIIVVANLDMAYTTKNGVKVIPACCLKD